MLQVQNLHYFKPGSFDSGFRIFTKGYISFKSGTQILHLGALMPRVGYSDGFERYSAYNWNLTKYFANPEKLLSTKSIVVLFSFLGGQGSKYIIRR